MANFPTRRLPQGASTTLSTGTSLTAHIEEANPHPQYLLVTNYAGNAGGSIDLSEYVQTSVFNQYKSEVSGWQSTHVNASNPHSQYCLTSTYEAGIANFVLTSTYNGFTNQVTSWQSTHVNASNPHSQYFLKANLFTETSVALSDIPVADRTTKAVSVGYALSKFMNIHDHLTTAPTNLDTTKAASGSYVAAINQKIDDHTNKNNWSQTQDGIISAHLDSTGNELYARRIHSHTITDFGAAAIDHNHDSVYLKQSDITSSRSKIAYGWIKDNQIIYTNSISPEVGDSTYLNNTMTISTGFTVSAVTADSITVNDSVYTRAATYDYTNYNVNALTNVFAPINHCHDEYITKYRSVNTLLPTTETNTISDANNVYARWRNADGVNSNDIPFYGWTTNGTNLFYTNSNDPGAGDTIYSNTGLTTAVSTITARSSSATLELDGEKADIQNYNLEGSTVASIKSTDGISSFSSGREIKLRITTTGRYTFTYNNVVLLSTEDIGTFIIHMGNYGGGVEVFGIVAVLA